VLSAEEKGERGRGAKKWTEKTYNGRKKRKGLLKKGNFYKNCERGAEL